MNQDKKNILIELLDDSNNSILIIGCRATKYFHECCEYNILMVGDKTESRIINDKKIGFIQIESMKRDEFLETSNKNASYLINNEILKDNYFTLSTKINDVGEHKSKIIKQYWNSTMIDVTTDVQKATNAMNKSSLYDSAYWTLSASYNLSKLSIAGEGLIQSPSHLLNQLKDRKNERNIDQYFNLLDLEVATKSSVERRLQALNNLNRSLATITNSNNELFARRMKLIDNKIRWFIKNRMITNAFVLLGYENTLIIKKIYKEYCNSKYLSTHNYKIISEILEEDMSTSVGKSTIKMLQMPMDEQRITEKLDILNNLLIEIRDNIAN